MLHCCTAVLLYCLQVDWWWLVFGETQQVGSLSNSHPLLHCSTGVLLYCCTAVLLYCLQVDWWRLVFDEAQQVGSLSNTAVMADYLQAQHRWVVTGTPLGAGGLSDVGNLLRLINASPFHETSVFRAAIERPFYASVEAAAAALAADTPDTAAAAAAGQLQGLANVGLDRCDSDEEGVGVRLSDASAAAAAAAGQGNGVGLASPPAAAAAAAGGGDAAAALMGAVSEALTPRYKRQERDGVRRLLALQQPLMWRTSKAVADLDHPLPPRCVCVWCKVSK
jgi:hypothetical protein